MKRLIMTVLILLCFQTKCVSAGIASVIKADENLYESAKSYFINSEFQVSNIPQGVILNFYLDENNIECDKINANKKSDILYAVKFLAKIKNPVIIEVHTKQVFGIKSGDLKNWERSTLIANNIEKFVIESGIDTERVKSVGYGEFFPEKNTPNNGSKKQNRVDIIILYNISGE